MFILTFQKHYADVCMKFQKYQRPVDFDPKLSHVKRELSDIEEKIHFMEVKNEDPAQVQRHLDQCMVSRKFYICLSHNSILLG